MDSTQVLSLGDALLASVIGMLVVLATLAALAVCIVLISKAVRIMEGGAKKAEAPKAAPAPVAAPAPAAASAPVQAAPAVPAGMVVLEENTSMGDLKLKNCDDKAAAMIMAIIADELKTPLNQLRFKSISRID